MLFQHGIRHGPKWECRQKQLHTGYNLFQFISSRHTFFLYVNTYIQHEIKRLNTRSFILMYVRVWICLYVWMSICIITFLLEILFFGSVYKIKSCRCISVINDKKSPHIIIEECEDKERISSKTGLEPATTMNIRCVLLLNYGSSYSVFITTIALYTYMFR